MAVTTFAQPPATPASKDGTNEPVERGRYAVGGRDRVLWVQRVEGRVCLTDAPPEGQRGHCYMVDDDLTGMARLDALVAAYLQMAAALGRIPARALRSRP